MTDSRNLSFVHFLLESVKNRFRLSTLIRLPNSAIFIAGATKKKKSQGPTKRKAAILDQFQDPNFDQPLLENSHQLSPIGNCDCYLISFLWVSLCPKTHESPFRGHAHPPLLKLPGHLSHLPVLPKKIVLLPARTSRTYVTDERCDRRALCPLAVLLFHVSREPQNAKVLISRFASCKVRFSEFESLQSKHIANDWPSVFTAVQ